MLPPPSGWRAGADVPWARAHMAAGEEAREPEQACGARLAISADHCRPAPGPWLNLEPPLSVPRSSADPWCPEAAASDIPAFWETPGGAH